MVTFWIQHADFSTTDGRPVSVDEAIRAFSGHDWESELTAAHKRSLSGADTCPPGIGFVPADAASDPISSCTSARNRGIWRMLPINTCRSLRSCWAWCVVRRCSRWRR